MREARFVPAPPVQCETGLQQALRLTWQPCALAAAAKSQDDASQGHSGQMRVMRCGGGVGRSKQDWLQVCWEAPLHTCYVARLSHMLQALRQELRMRSARCLQWLKFEMAAPMQQRTGWLFVPVACLAMMMALAAVPLAALLLYAVAWAACGVLEAEWIVVVQFHKSLLACSFGFLF